MELLYRRGAHVGRPSDYGDDKQHDQYELCPGFTRAPHVEAPTKKALPSGAALFTKSYNYKFCKFHTLLLFSLR